MDRWRSKKYMAHIRSKPCLICGGPSQAHHLTYAEARMMGRKNGDNWCVPVCHSHHHQLHHFAGGERTFWAVNGIDPERWAASEFQKWSNDNGNTE